MKLSDQTLNDLYEDLKKVTRQHCEADRERFKSGLETFESYCQRKEQETVDCVKSFIEGCKQSFMLIVEEFVKANDEEALTELVRGVHVYEAKPADESGVFPLNLSFGYSEELLEKIYQIGLNRMNQGLFADSSKVFSLLILFDPGYSSVWIMLGVSYERERLWEQSLQALKVAMDIDPDNPLPYVHAAVCFRELGKYTEAQEALRKGMKNAEADKKYAPLKAAVSALPR